MGLATGATLAGCGGEATSDNTPANWAWLRTDYDTDDAWQRTFERMRTSGIDGVIIHEDRLFPDATAGLQADPDPRPLELAQQAGLTPQVWVVAMRREELLEAHPDWFAVNREGVSTAEDPPYVDYYRFLSPCVPGVRNYLADYVDRLGQIDALQAIHLDYIRFPDVILPEAIQPTYDLTQDREMAQFDYGYHPMCRDAFASAVGVDPMTLDDPAAHQEWVQFRHDQITQVVRRLGDAAHQRNKQVTAAVFPTPDIARRLVRQDWPSWNLDAVMPMIYHNFYHKDIPWIETATRQGVEALPAGTPLYSGLFVPEIAPGRVPDAVRAARDGGARGITLFNVDAMTEAHWSALASVAT